jgi:diacylglycerol O-acyltransferase / wax synthase
MIQLSVQDAAFLAMDKPSTPSNGGVVFIYDRGGMSFQDVFTHFQQRLHLVDVLRLKLLRVPGNLGRPYWVEDHNLDLEYHISNIALPQPGDWRQFCHQVSRLISRPLDLTRPPWELHMIEGLDSVDQFSADSFALVLKVHHAALDGRAFLGIMSILHSLDKNAAPPPPPHETQALDSDTSPVAVLTKAYANALQTPLKTARILGRTLPALRQLVTPKQQRYDVEPALPPLPPTPQTRFNRAVGPHRSWGACFFDLAELKSIRNAVEGATVHDIAMTVIGGALRKYLDDAGELPADSLRTGIVIDVRTEGDHQALGNQLSGMFATLGTDIKDPLARLAAVRASTHKSKNLSAKMGARNVSDLLELAPEAILAPAMNLLLDIGNREGRGLFGKMNTAVTGMAGPPRPLYLGSAEMSHLMVFGPLTDGLGLLNVQHSYNGEFQLAFTADRDAMPDPGRYEECIYQSFDDLRGAVRPRRKTNSRRKTNRMKP